MKIIGGFDGSETSASQSDPAANETILDGEETTQAVWSTGNTDINVIGAGDR